MRCWAFSLLLFACGDDSGSPGHKPVLGLGSFAGTFDDGAADTVHGLIGVTADAEGRIVMRVQRLELPYFEVSVAGNLWEGINTYHPLVAFNSVGLLSDATVMAAGGNVHAVMTTHPQGDPTADRTITINGTLGKTGGSGTFTEISSSGTVSGTWQLMPGLVLDAGQPMPPDAPMADAPEVDAPEVDAGVD